MVDGDGVNHPEFHSASCVKSAVFFAGYFVALLLNIVLPVMLERNTT